VPKRLLALMTDPDAGKARRAMQAMLTMKRIDIAAVERAAEGELVT
jgi:predicted 3-demethylubiquinone-9 3-methyltransferase (glyoxalase superfamily)